jgi:hypothetical protein
MQTLVQVLLGKKHRQLNQPATSFMNMGKKVTRKHQKDQRILWNTYENRIDETEINVSNKATVIVENMTYADIIAAEHDTDWFEEVHFCDKVACNCVDYCFQDVEITAFDLNNKHTLLQISGIVVYNRRNLLIGSSLQTIHFDNYFKANVAQ